MPAVTDTGFVPMRVTKVTALGRAVRDDVAFYVVLDEAGGGRQLVILIGQEEALGLAFTLDPAGVERGIDARSCDALNLAVLLGTPIFAAPEMLDDCARRMEGDSPEAVMARRALTAPAMTFVRRDE